MMLSNHYPVTYANASVIPALVTLVIIAGALVRYFYNMWHGDHDKAPWWAWFVAAVAIWAAFWVCMAASPGMRNVIGLGRRAARRRRLGEPAESAGRSRQCRLDALFDVPYARTCVRRHWRGAEGRAARHARAYRQIRAGDPHAGGA